MILIIVHILLSHSFQHEINRKLYLFSTYIEALSVGPSIYVSNNIIGSSGSNQVK